MRCPDAAARRPCHDYEWTSPIDPINPRFEHQQFHLLSTTDRRDPEQRICLAQTKKRVGFLTTGRRELSVFESPADVMRSIAVVR